MSRIQQEVKTLPQISNELNRQAAKCKFGRNTEGLVNDVFIVNKVNKDVQQNLSTDLKATIQKTIQFAIVHQKGATRQQSFSEHPIDKLEKPNLKTETNETNNINKYVATRYDPEINASDVKQNSHNSF